MLLCSGETGAGGWTSGTGRGREAETTGSGSSGTGQHLSNLCNCRSKLKWTNSGIVNITTTKLIKRSIDINKLYGISHWSLLVVSHLGKAKLVNYKQILGHVADQNYTAIPELIQFNVSSEINFVLHRPNWKKQRRRDLLEKRQPNNRLRNSRNNKKKQLRNYEKKSKRESTTDSWDWSTTLTLKSWWRTECRRMRRLPSSMIPTPT